MYEDLDGYSRNFSHLNRTGLVYGGYRDDVARIEAAGYGELPRAGDWGNIYYYIFSHGRWYCRFFHCFSQS